MKKTFLKRSGSLLIADNGAGDSALLSQFKANIEVYVNVHEHYVLIWILMSDGMHIWRFLIGDQCQVASQHTTSDQDDIHQLSMSRTLRLKHGWVVIDVLNEHSHRQVRGAAVPAVTSQTEPKQILVITIFYCGKGDGRVTNISTLPCFNNTFLGALGGPQIVPL